MKSHVYHITYLLISDSNPRYFPMLNNLTDSGSHIRDLISTVCELNITV